MEAAKTQTVNIQYTVQHMIHFDDKKSYWIFAFIVYIVNLLVLPLISLQLECIMENIQSQKEGIYYK